MSRNPMSDIVVVIPGILGSALSQGKKDIWAPSAGAAARAICTFFDSILKLQLDQDPSPDDGVTASRIIHHAHMIPGLTKNNGYAELTRVILGQFAVEKGRNFFEFPYDWRRDNRVAARRLAGLAPRWIEQWKQYSGAANPRLFLLVHSMGGLVARYFLEVLGGWQYTRALVSFGTPYRGSLDSLDYIANGFQKKFGFIPIVDLTDLLRSMPSVYQLLPTYPCCAIGEGPMLRVHEVDGIPNMDPLKAADARAFHDEIDSAAQSNLKNETYVRSGYSLHPIVGVWQPTLQSARLREKKLTVLREYPGQRADGDGRVPRASAVPKDRAEDRREMFVSARHSTLQSMGTVLVQVEGVLSAADFDSDAFRAERLKLALDLEDSYAPDEPIAIRIRSEREGPSLLLSIFEVETGAEVSRQSVHCTPHVWTEAITSPLPPGTYRAVVSAPRRLRLWPTYSAC